MHACIHTCIVIHTQFCGVYLTEGETHAVMSDPQCLLSALTQASASSLFPSLSPSFAPTFSPSSNSSPPSPLIHKSRSPYLTQSAHFSHAGLNPKP